MTRYFFKKKKNSVLFLRTVMTLTQSSEYIIANKTLAFIFSSKIQRSEEGVLNRFIVRWKNINDCQVENVQVFLRDASLWWLGSLPSEQPATLLLMGHSLDREPAGVVDEGTGSDQGWHLVNSKMLSCLFFLLWGGTLPCLLGGTLKSVLFQMIEQVTIVHGHELKNLGT